MEYAFSVIQGVQTHGHLEFFLCCLLEELVLILLKLFPKKLFQKNSLTDSTKPASP